MIKEAAIKLKDGRVFVGHRHDKIILGHPGEDFKRPNSTQGFITGNGKFVDRKEAGRIAFECGQIKKLTDHLSSEDLY